MRTKTQGGKKEVKFIDLTKKDIKARKGTYEINDNLVVLHGSSIFRVKLHK